MARWLAARWWRVTAPESLGEVLTGAVAGAVGARDGALANWLTIAWKA